MGGEMDRALEKWVWKELTLSVTNFTAGEDILITAAACKYPGGGLLGFKMEMYELCPFWMILKAF
jgi:hypothetical protein